MRSPCNLEFIIKYKKLYFLDFSKAPSDYFAHQIAMKAFAKTLAQDLMMDPKQKNWINQLMKYCEKFLEDQSGYSRDVLNSAIKSDNFKNKIMNRKKLENVIDTAVAQNKENKLKVH